MDSMSDMERRCLKVAWDRAYAMTEFGIDENALAIVRAVLAEAGVAELVEALQGLLTFCPADTEKQDRLVLAARTALAKARA